MGILSRSEEKVLAEVSAKIIDEIISGYRLFRFNGTLNEMKGN